jgi:hypothetical protein
MQDRSKKYLRSTLFWDFTQRRMVVCYQRFGTTYRYRYKSQTVRLLYLRDETNWLSRNVLLCKEQVQNLWHNMAAGARHFRDSIISVILAVVSVTSRK